MVAQYKSDNILSFFLLQKKKQMALSPFVGLDTFFKEAKYLCTPRMEYSCDKCLIDCIASRAKQAYLCFVHSDNCANKTTFDASLLFSMPLERFKSLLPQSSDWPIAFVYASVFCTDHEFPILFSNDDHLARWLLICKAPGYEQAVFEAFVYSLFNVVNTDGNHRRNLTFAFSWMKYFLTHECGYSGDNTCHGNTFKVMRFLDFLKLYTPVYTPVYTTTGMYVSNSSGIPLGMRFHPLEVCCAFDCVSDKTARIESPQSGMRTFRNNYEKEKAYETTPQTRPPVSVLAFWRGVAHACKAIDKYVEEEHLSAEKAGAFSKSIHGCPLGLQIYARVAWCSSFSCMAGRSINQESAGLENMGLCHAVLDVLAGGIDAGSGIGTGGVFEDWTIDEQSLFFCRANHDMLVLALDCCFQERTMHEIGRAKGRIRMAITFLLRKWMSLLSTAKWCLHWELHQHLVCALQMFLPFDLVFPSERSREAIKFVFECLGDTCYENHRLVNHLLTDFYTSRAYFFWKGWDAAFSNSVAPPEYMIPLRDGMKECFFQWLVAFQSEFFWRRFEETEGRGNWFEALSETMSENLNKFSFSFPSSDYLRLLEASLFVCQAGVGVPNCGFVSSCSGSCRHSAPSGDVVQADPLTNMFHISSSYSKSKNVSWPRIFSHPSSFCISNNAMKRFGNLPDLHIILYYVNQCSSKTFLFWKHYGFEFASRIFQSRGIVQKVYRAFLLFVDFDTVHDIYKKKKKICFNLFPKEEYDFFSSIFEKTIVLLRRMRSFVVEYGLGPVLEGIQILKANFWKLIAYSKFNAACMKGLQNVLFSRGRVVKYTEKEESMLASETIVLHEARIDWRDVFEKNWHIVRMIGRDQTYLTSPFPFFYLAQELCRLGCLPSVKECQTANSVYKLCEDRCHLSSFPRGQVMTLVLDHYLPLAHLVAAIESLQKHKFVSFFLKTHIYPAVLKKARLYGRQVFDRLMDF